MLPVGIARIEDVNMFVCLPDRIYPPAGTPGRTEQRLFVQQDLVLDPAGSCITLWNGNAYRRYRIDIRPDDELAIECLFVIKEFDPSFYKTLVKQWIRDHCTVALIGARLEHSVCVSIGKQSSFQ